MTAVDRFAPEYEPRFDIDAEYGRQAELFVDDIRAGLRDGSVEVKRDGRWKDTGNLFVEFKCLRRGKWEPSGIATTAAEVWVFVIERLAVVIPTDLLKEESRKWFHRGRVTGGGETGSHPTKGVLVPLSGLLEFVRSNKGGTFDES